MESGECCFDVILTFDTQFKATRMKVQTEIENMISVIIWIIEPN